MPITEDTIFQLASVSKTFTACAVMLAVRQGLLSLEDRIVTYFPELTAYEGVTVRHLLNHTGGVPDYFDDMDWFFRIWREEKRVPGNDEILRFLCETSCKPSFAPGENACKVVNPFDAQTPRIRIVAESCADASATPLPTATGACGPSSGRSLAIAGRTCMTIDAATDGEIFYQYVVRVLVPELRPGNIVVLDNLRNHKQQRVTAAIEESGGRVEFLPP